MKFTKAGGVTVRHTISRDSIAFEVEDTGSGIAAEAHDKVFENFMQEDTSSTRGYEGSGLGLSIVKGMLDILGGDIALKSEKGRGSVFSFRIPLDEPVDESVTDSLQRATAENGRDAFVILIVEDNFLNRQFLDIVLRKSGSQVLQATNGQEAVEMCRQHPEISLVLMDLKMPGMNGFDATKEIKSFRRYLPIIAVSAFAMSGDEQSARDAGCDDFISKPVSAIRLYEELKKFGIIQLK
jgi:CheY-like chemotaxis protein